jgi:hypothetical protein
MDGISMEAEHDFWDRSYRTCDIAQVGAWRSQCSGDRFNDWVDLLQRPQCQS